MKVLIAGGGTGGHIYPALTIADAIRHKVPDAEITFVGTRKGLERDIVPRYGYPLNLSASPGLNAIWVWERSKARRLWSAE